MLRCATQQSIHLSKIKISELIYNLLENTELIRYCNSIVDTSGVDNFDDNARKKLLHDMLS